MSTAIEAGLKTYLKERRVEVEEAIQRILPADGSEPKELVSAMRYSVLAGGKRLRPILFLAAADTCEGTSRGAPRGELADAAAALELFHTYSLIHDDLPCMDNDSLRRGRATCHVVYGEATALLAGDTLQTLGFEVLATRPGGAGFAARRAEAVALAADAIGLAGMAGGQALDLASEGAARDVGAARRLKTIHSLKTGRLLSASVELGALHAGASPETLAAVRAYGETLGLVFQIADDLLNVTSDAQTLGKTAGKDAEQEKLTYPAVFGLEGTRRELERALAEAQAAARRVEGEPGILAALAGYAAHRDR
jgi:farnesyl diphosphate synthase